MEEVQAPAENAVVAAAKIAGSQVDLARALKVSEQAICKWVKRGYVPLARAKEIEAMFGVPRTRLVDPRLLDLIDSVAAV